MAGTAISRGWTAADESVQVTGAGFLTGRVKGGSAYNVVLQLQHPRPVDYVSFARSKVRKNAIESRLLGSNQG
jgi:hypothetical protein